MENKKIEVKGYGYELTIKVTDNSVVFNMKIENELETSVEVEKNKNGINPHEIGRTIENNYIKNDQINIEPYKLSRIIGLIENGLKQIEVK